MKIFVFAIQVIFLVILSSYYFILLFFKKKNVQLENTTKSISILIPARNEEKFISECVKSCIEANYPAKKEVIVINDASTDETRKILKKFQVKVINLKKHTGKADALNIGIKKSKGELIAVVDADSVISKDSLIEASKFFYDSDVAAVTSVILVKNKTKFLGMWQNIEQMFNSLIRDILSRVNLNIVTPGPLTIFNKKDLVSLGGFSREGYSEDVDIAIRIIRSGKKIEFSTKSVSLTNMPVSLSGFLKQRIRFARGWIHVFKKHLRFKKNKIDYYSLPISLFWFMQAAVVSISMISQIVGDYIKYFFSKGIIFNSSVLTFFIDWFTLSGTIKWIKNTLVYGPVDLITLVGILTTILSYFLYVYAISKYEERITLFDIIPLLFMFPYWFIIMITYILNIPELFLSIRENRWEKVN